MKMWESILGENVKMAKKKEQNNLKKKKPAAAPTIDCWCVRHCLVDNRGGSGSNCAPSSSSQSQNSAVIACALECKKFNQIYRAMPTAECAHTMAQSLVLLSDLLSVFLFIHSFIVSFAVCCAPTYTNSNSSRFFPIPNASVFPIPNAFFRAFSQFTS